MSSITIQAGLLAFSALCIAFQALTLLKVVRRLRQAAETLRDAEAVRAFSERGERP